MLYWQIAKHLDLTISNLIEHLMLVKLLVELLLFFMWQKKKLTVGTNIIWPLGMVTLLLLVLSFL